MLSDKPGHVTVMRTPAEKQWSTLIMNSYVRIMFCPREHSDLYYERYFACVLSFRSFRPWCFKGFVRMTRLRVLKTVMMWTHSCIKHNRSIFNWSFCLQGVQRQEEVRWETESCVWRVSLSEVWAPSADHNALHHTARRLSCVYCECSLNMCTCSRSHQALWSERLLS